MRTRIPASACPSRHGSAGFSPSVQLLSLSVTPLSSPSAFIDEMTTSLDNLSAMPNSESDLRSALTHATQIKLARHLPSRNADLVAECIVDYLKDKGPSTTYYCSPGEYQAPTGAYTVLMNSISHSTEHGIDAGEENDDFLSRLLKDLTRDGKLPTGKRLRRAIQNVFEQKPCTEAKPASVDNFICDARTLLESWELSGDSGDVPGKASPSWMRGDKSWIKGDNTQPEPGEGPAGSEDTHDNPEQSWRRYETPAAGTFERGEFKKNESAILAAREGRMSTAHERHMLTSATYCVLRHLRPFLGPQELWPLAGRIVGVLADNNEHTLLMKSLGDMSRGYPGNVNFVGLAKSTDGNELPSADTVLSGVELKIPGKGRQYTPSDLADWTEQLMQYCETGTGDFPLPGLYKQNEKNSAPGTPPGTTHEHAEWWQSFNKMTVDDSVPTEEGVTAPAAFKQNDEGNAVILASYIDKILERSFAQEQLTPEQRATLTWQVIDTAKKVMGSNAEDFLFRSITEQISRYGYDEKVAAAIQQLGVATKKLRQQQAELKKDQDIRDRMSSRHADAGALNTAGKCVDTSKASVELCRAEVANARRIKEDEESRLFEFNRASVGLNFGHMVIADWDSLEERVDKLRRGTEWESLPGETVKALLIQLAEKVMTTAVSLGGAYTQAKADGRQNGSMRDVYPASEKMYPDTMETWSINTDKKAAQPSRTDAMHQQVDSEGKLVREPEVSRRAAGTDSSGALADRTVQATNNPEDFLRDVKPAVSGFLSRELSKLNKKKEAYRGIYCEMQPLAWNKVGKPLATVGGGRGEQSEHSLWNVTFTGYVSAGDGKCLPIQQWRTELRADDKAPGDNSLLSQNYGDTHVLNQIGQFLAGRPVSIEKIVPARIVESESGWGEMLLVQLHRADKAFGRIMQIFPGASADNSLLGLRVTGPVEPNLLGIRNEILKMLSIPLVPLATHGVNTVKEWLGLGASVDSGEVNTRQPEGYSPSSTEEPLMKSEIMPTAMELLRGALGTELGAVIPDAAGNLNVTTLGDLLRGLREQYPDDREFVKEARGLLKDNGLLDMLDSLLPQPLPTDPHVRRRRDLAQEIRGVSSQQSEQLQVLNQLMEQPGAEEVQSKAVYLTAWRDRLPQGEETAWLRNAPENRQNAYKELLDMVAGQEAALEESTRVLETETPGYHQMTEKLNVLGLTQQPENIILTATLMERAGSLSVPVTLRLTLKEAWETGALNEILRARQLGVDDRTARRVMGESELTAFRAAMDGLAPAPDVTTLANDARINLAFRQMTEAQFELSTLAAELKGELRTNDHIRGLLIMNRFRKGDQSVKAGQLTFGFSDVTGRNIQATISGWLVLRDSNGSCVLYDANLSTRNHYFSSEQGMLQFVSEKAMKDTVAAERLEAAAMAERTPDAWRMAEFFHELSNNAKVWIDRKATLNFEPIAASNLEDAMATFAGGLLRRNAGVLSYNSATQQEAARTMRLLGKWDSMQVSKAMPSLLEYTSQWVKGREEYGNYLVGKGVYTHSTDFNPDDVLIKPLHGGNVGSVTEYALYRRRQEEGGHNFADEMEVLPKEVVANDYISALTPAEKGALLAELERLVQTGNSTTTFRFIDTLSMEERQSLYRALQLYQKLNDPSVKAGLDQALRNGYPGSDYQTMLGTKLDLSKPENLLLHDTYIASVVSGIKLALSMAREDGKESDGAGINEADALRISNLLEGYPANTRSALDLMAPLTIGGVSVPGMVMFRLRDSKSRRGQVRQYVYTPQAIHGSHFFSAGDFNKLMLSSNKARDVVASQVLLIDTNNIENVFKKAASGRARAGYGQFTGYDMYSQMVEKRIADASEQTISRWEVIRDATIEGVGILAMPVCLGSGPVSTVGCMAMSGILMADNIRVTADLARRGETNWALFTGITGALDVTDVTSGVGIIARAAGVGKLLRNVGRNVPDVLRGVPGGAPALLRKGGRLAFSNGADVAESMVMDRLPSAFEFGRLKRDWAVNVDLSEARRTTPPGQPAGDFYVLNGKMYIWERGYAWETPLVYEVKAENGGVVRVVNPAHPNVPADRIKWSEELWVKDNSGLLGGVNDVGTFNRKIDEMYAIRDNNGRPLYITRISDTSVSSQSGTSYSSQSVMPFIDNAFMNKDVPKTIKDINNVNDSEYKQTRKVLYENNINVRRITVDDVPQNEAALIGQFGSFAARDIKRGEAIGVYGGRVVSSRQVGKDEFLMNAFQIKSAPGDNVRDLRYSGENSISRVNTIYELDNGQLKQASAGYNSEAASFDITVLGYAPRQRTIDLRLVVLYAKEDIPQGKEFRWNYGYSAESVRESLT